MATTSELLVAGLYLIINTIVIAVFILVGGPVFGYIFSWLSTQSFDPSNPISPAMIQWIPGFFFMFLLVLEIVLVIRLGYVIISRTDYQGATEW